MLTAETIEILGPLGSMKVEAFRLRELAVHRTLSDKAWWTITHLPTGLSFGFRWRGNVAAISAMEALAGLRPSWKCTAIDVEETPGIYEVLTKAGGQRYQISPKSVNEPRLNGY